MRDFIFCSDVNHDHRVKPGENPRIRKARLIRWGRNKYTVKPICDVCAPYYDDLMDIGEAIRRRDAVRPKIESPRRNTPIPKFRTKPRLIERDPHRIREDVDWEKEMKPFLREAEGKGCELRHQPGKCSVPGCHGAPWAHTYRSGNTFPLCRVHANASYKVFKMYEVKGIVLKLFRSKKIRLEKKSSSHHDHQPAAQVTGLE